jgi:hypothetical protein
MNIADMAADYKFRRMNKYRAWDQYVIDCGLKPKIDAAEFYDIFEKVTASSLHVYKLPPDYLPTHYDNILKRECQIKIDHNEVVHIVWSDGHTGSNPKDFHEQERYITIQEVK